jgi:hypothetical protein
MRRSEGPGVTQVPTTRGRPFANGNSGRKAGSKNRLHSLQRHCWKAKLTS